MEKKNYYLGLDLGTNSVGWAVTDREYNLLSFKNKDMWGARLFDEGKTSSERRVFRSSRRRLARKKQRISILQELFSEEIQKKDPLFFLRLKESKYYLEDKKLESKYAVFDDEDYSDKEYYDEYPTIYHLRRDLISSDAKKDIRLYYLALHHIIKYRGHFLFQGKEFSVADQIGKIMTDLNTYLQDNFSFELPLDRLPELEEALVSDLGIRDKANRIIDICDARDKQFKDILNVMIGGSRKLDVLFKKEEYQEAEKKDICFKKSSFDEEYEVYAHILQDDIQLLLHLKAVYDWMVLRKILKDYKYISEAKIDEFDRHKRELDTLKYFVKKYGKPGEVNRCFNDENTKDNYASYTRHTLNNGKKKAEKYTDQEGVNKFFHKVLSEYKVEEKDKKEYQIIMEVLDKKEALPKQRTSDNGVIPYQIHKMELDIILENLGKNYPSFLEKDENGMDAIEKIKRTMTFRIPYYIGPLNSYHGEENGGTGNAWIVRKKEGRILPWNFDEMVNEEESAEKFIRRMTNKCTYLNGADVIPNQSLLYEKFKVLNELNKLKLNGKEISVELKKSIFTDLFLMYKRVTKKGLKSYLKSQGWTDEVEISGIDGDFKSSMSSYLAFYKYLGIK